MTDGIDQEDLTPYSRKTTCRVEVSFMTTSRRALAFFVGNCVGEMACSIANHRLSDWLLLEDSWRFAKVIRKDFRRRYS